MDVLEGSRPHMDMSLKIMVKVPHLIVDHTYCSVHLLAQGLNLTARHLQVFVVLEQDARFVCPSFNIDQKRKPHNLISESLQSKSKCVITEHTSTGPKGEAGYKGR